MIERTREYLVRRLGIQLHLADGLLDRTEFTHQAQGHVQEAILCFKTLKDICE